MRYRLANQLSICNPKTRRMTLEIEPFARPGTSRTVAFSCAPPRYKNMDTYTEPRPQTAMEIKPGIVYVDFDRLTEPEWKALIPRLKKAKGIVFDMRGYPGEVGIHGPGASNPQPDPQRQVVYRLGGNARPTRFPPYRKRLGCTAEETVFPR